MLKILLIPLFLEALLWLNEWKAKVSMNFQAILNFNRQSTTSEETPSQSLIPKDKKLWENWIPKKVEWLIKSKPKGQKYLSMSSYQMLLRRKSSKKDNKNLKKKLPKTRIKLQIKSWVNLTLKIYQHFSVKSTLRILFKASLAMHLAFWLEIWLVRLVEEESEVWSKDYFDSSLNLLSKNQLLPLVSSLRSLQSR